MTKHLYILKYTRIIRIIKSYLSGPPTNHISIFTGYNMQPGPNLSVSEPTTSPFDDNFQSTSRTHIAHFQSLMSAIAADTPLAFCLSVIIIRYDRWSPDTIAACLPTPPRQQLKPHTHAYNARTHTTHTHTSLWYWTLVSNTTPCYHVSRLSTESNQYQNKLN